MAEQRHVKARRCWRELKMASNRLPLTDSLTNGFEEIQGYQLEKMLLIKFLVQRSFNFVLALVFEFANDRNFRFFLNILDSNNSSGLFDGSPKNFRHYE